MMRLFHAATAAVAVAACTSLGLARPAWVEVGDAPYGFNGAQNTVGAGALTAISGSTDAPNVATYNDIIDVFAIRITDVAQFRATTNSTIDPTASVVGVGAFAGTDTRLYLLSSPNGQPLLINDDSGTTLQSVLTAPGSFATSGAGGIVTAQANTINLVAGQTYYLAVGCYSAIPGHDNLDGTFAFTMEQPGVDTPSFTDLAGPLAGAPVSDTWIGTGAASTFNYTVALRGAAFAQDVPEPASLALLGLTGLTALRRRR